MASMTSCAMPSKRIIFKDGGEWVGVDVDI